MNFISSANKWPNNPGWNYLVSVARLLSGPILGTHFPAIVDTADIPIVTKFTSLEGDAKSAIAGLSFTGDHYKIACDILCYRFGRHKKIIFAHIQELMNITMPSK